MHGEVDPSVGPGLGLFFLIFGIMNVYYCLRCFFITKRIGVGIVWTLFTIFLLGTSAEFYQGRGIELPESFKSTVDSLVNPVSYFFIACVAFVALLVFRRQFVDPFNAWVLFNLSVLYIGLSLTDYDFRNIVAKPDNVPISILIYSVAFCTWIALRQAVINDDRIAAGVKPVEAEGAQKVLTWPDLVYTELLAMVLCTIFLIVWSILLKAPLEPPASPTEIPNPSKAPWYFLGLQEMLVYFDPWLAGVLLPTWIILGLCAMPYVDYNTKGNGYYTFNERKFAIVTWLFGFLVLWVVLIVLGTFLRGPNWNFFGFYETWSPYKNVAANNINLSDIVWIDLLGAGKPEGSSLSAILIRESFGILLVIFYFLALPLILAKTLMKPMFLRMGTWRYLVMSNVFLMMMLLPLKMLLRWTVNLKYIVYIPEFFFNI